MDEHAVLVDDADHIRRALASGDPGDATSRLAGLVARLQRHVEREEDGIFTALRSAGEALDELGELADEHRDFESTIAGLDVDSPDFEARLIRLLDDLGAHVDREDYGLFPFSVVTLGAAGWTIIDQVHARSPSFLLDPEPTKEETRCRRSH